MFVRPAVYVIALLALAVPAQAQRPCGSRAEIVKVLAAKYQELPKALGTAGRSNLIELFVSTTGSFTMLETQPHGGITCILVTGEGWQELPPTIPGRPS